ncbi:hypothetical protein BT96DRAFT_924698, partial [Gymnopus androsaceus JB14]
MLTPSVPARNANQPELVAGSFISNLAWVAWGKGIVEVGDEVEEKMKVKDSGDVSFLLRYKRGFGWKDRVTCSSQAVGYTLVDELLPRLPASKYENKPALKTIHNNLNLFQIPHFKEMLRAHPNHVGISKTPLSLSPYPLALLQYPLYRMHSSHTYSRSSHLPDILFVHRTVYKP